VPAHRRVIDAPLVHLVDERELHRICKAALVRAAIALRSGGCGRVSTVVERLALAALLASFSYGRSGWEHAPQR
jgi:hypothetical protein